MTIIFQAVTIYITMNSGKWCDVLAVINETNTLSC